jgi:hypothetical protein
MALAANASGGGCQSWLASVLRFCTMAARWNSSRAPETPQAHTLEAVMGFEVRKSHLDLLALVARLFELRRTHEAARMIAGILMDVACDLARWRVRTALRLEWTCAAVYLFKNAKGPA